MKSLSYWLTILLLPLGAAVGVSSSQARQVALQRAIVWQNATLTLRISYYISGLSWKHGKQDSENRHLVPPHKGIDVAQKDERHNAGSLPVAAVVSGTVNPVTWPSSRASNNASLADKSTSNSLFTERL